VLRSSSYIVFRKLHLYLLDLFVKIGKLIQLKPMFCFVTGVLVNLVYLSEALEVNGTWWVRKNRIDHIVRHTRLVLIWSFLDFDFVKKVRRRNISVRC
jgi:hypothetical protein